MKCISVVENQYLFVVSSKVNCYFLFPPSPCQLIHLLSVFPVCLTISASIVNFFHCSYLQFFLQLRGKKENVMCRQLKQGLNFVQPQGLSLNPHPLFRSFKERHLKSYSVSQILFDFLFSRMVHIPKVALESLVILLLIRNTVQFPASSDWPYKCDHKRVAYRQVQ